MGQIYVLISRCTDPMNFILCGVPPKDLIEELSQALIAAGINVDQYFKTACSVTNEWVYDESIGRVKDRFKLKFNSERGIPLKNRTLAEVLCPQPAASVVIKRLLHWIDRVDRRTCAAKPSFETEDGQSIFPESDEPWWLTDMHAEYQKKSRWKETKTDRLPTSTSTRVCHQRNARASRGDRR